MGTNEVFCQGERVQVMYTSDTGVFIKRGHVGYIDSLPYNDYEDIIHYDVGFASSDLYDGSNGFAERDYYRCISCEHLERVIEYEYDDEGVL